MNYNANQLYKVVDFYDFKVFPLKERDPDKYNEIMKEAFRRTHKSPPSKKVLEVWTEKFPVILDQKIEAEKKKIKQKLKDPAKSRRAQERYKVSQLRNRNIINQLAKLGYHGVNEGDKMAMMKEGLENDEIINALVNDIADPMGGDHDMVEIQYDDQFKKHIQGYKERYKYSYIVEDETPPTQKEEIDTTSIEKPKEKPLTTRQSNYQSHTIKFGDMRPIGIKNTKFCSDCGLSGKRLYSEPCFEKKTRKEIMEKIYPPKKPVSTLIVSNNPIKITPVEKLELSTPKKRTPKKYVTKKEIGKAMIRSDVKGLQEKAWEKEKQQIQIRMRNRCIKCKEKCIFLPIMDKEIASGISEFRKEIMPQKNKIWDEPNVITGKFYPPYQCQKIYEVYTGKKIVQKPSKKAIPSKKISKPTTTPTKPKTIKTPIKKKPQPKKTTPSKTKSTLKRQKGYSYYKTDGTLVKVPSHKRKISNKKK